MIDKIAIILVNYNGFQDTMECIDSLQKVSFQNKEIIVVDNASTDSSCEKLEQFCGSNGVVYLETEKNIGFSGGNNVGIRYALERDFSHVLLLNNDTIVEEQFLERLLACSKEYDDEAIVTSKIRYAYERDKIWYAGGKFSYLTSRTEHIGINEKDCGQYDLQREVSFVSGCCMLIPGKVIEKTGMLGEDYFLYCEDLDFCCRAKKAGMKLIFCPDAVIYHKVSATTGQISNSYAYYIARNKRIIIERYISGCIKVFASLYTFLEEEKRIYKREYARTAIKKGRRDFRNHVVGEA